MTSVLDTFKPNGCVKRLADPDDRIAQSSSTT